MMKSYDATYLENVANNIASIVEYAYFYDENLVDFWNIFITSNIANEIEKGNPKYLVGYSGFELYLKLVKKENLESIDLLNRTRYFWVGWILAHYQYYSSLTFFEINKYISIEKAISLYSTLHEADVTKFYEYVDTIIIKNKKETNLKKIRRCAGYSQSQLAKKANVSIRNIQMYEQRNNNINKAQADILYRLSKTLGCDIKDLFEQ